MFDLHYNRSLNFVLHRFRLLQAVLTQGCGFDFLFVKLSILAVEVLSFALVLLIPFIGVLLIIFALLNFLPFLFDRLLLQVLLKYSDVNLLAASFSTFSTCLSSIEQAKSIWDICVFAQTFTFYRDNVIEACKLLLLILEIWLVLKKYTIEVLDLRLFLIWMHLLLWLSLIQRWLQTLLWISVSWLRLFLSVASYSRWILPCGFTFSE